MPEPQHGRIVCGGEREGGREGVHLLSPVCVQTQAPVSLLALMLREKSFGPSLGILGSSTQDFSLSWVSLSPPVGLAGPEQVQQGILRQKE